MAKIASKGRVLVTGATGFIGSSVVHELVAAGWSVRACGRDRSRQPGNCEFVAADLAADTDFDALVRDIDVVLHLAARVHVMKETSSDPLAEFRRANVIPTARLAAAAVKNGLRHFVFASSIKVHGESSTAKPFIESDPLNPKDAYGVSKMEAERAVLIETKNSKTNTTIFRLPLVYGPRVKGNFSRLVSLVRSGLPLPFAGIANLRSMLYVGNFSSAVLTRLAHPMQGNKVFLLADGHDVSTEQLVRILGKSMDCRVRLFPMPNGVLRFAASLTGRRNEFERLTESLQVDISCIRQTLQWTPPYSVGEGVAKSFIGYSGSGVSV